MEEENALIPQHRTVLNILMNQNTSKCNGEAQAVGPHTFHVVKMIDMEQFSVLF